MYRCLSSDELVLQVDWRAVPSAAWGALLWAGWGMPTCHVSVVNFWIIPYVHVHQAGGLARSAAGGVGRAAVGGLGHQLGGALRHLLGGRPLRRHRPQHLRLPAGGSAEV